jgi:hypothetical protein
MELGRTILEHWAGHDLGLFGMGSSLSRGKRDV